MTTPHVQSRVARANVRTPVSGRRERPSGFSPPGIAAGQNVTHNITDALGVVDRHTGRDRDRPIFGRDPGPACYADAEDRAILHADVHDIGKLDVPIPPPEESIAEDLHAIASHDQSFDASKVFSDHRPIAEGEKEIRNQGKHSGED